MKKERLRDEEKDTNYFKYTSTFFTAISWLFPYSALSLTKSYTYKPDRVVVDQFLQDLKEFKEFYEEHPKKNDLTTERVQYILQSYDLPWINTKEPVKMAHQELDLILFEVEKARKVLIDF
ncbi:hypothetical protein QGM71_11440 [Virgibacillus sp. C22-A2]|uniref:Uncharacterized protein n=1 Tax=Virgibacillus tibetensis TaxID=3042313 RepID=A0ABU6KFZ4_9BACI|nr:hypothetical protein [Virgibacillus sp. C22-A2]